MAVLVSVNVARPLAADYTADGLTGIDKRPVAGPVSVAAPGPSPLGKRGPVRTAGCGVAGDSVYFRGHGGDHQAVYAYAREDLDAWAEELDREVTEHGLLPRVLPAMDAMNPLHAREVRSRLEASRGTS